MRWFWAAQSQKLRTDFSWAKAFVWSSDFPWVSIVVGGYILWWALCKARCGEAEILTMGNEPMANDPMPKIDIIMVLLLLLHVKMSVFSVLFSVEI